MTTCPVTRSPASEHLVRFPIGRESPLRLPPVYAEELVQQRCTTVRVSDDRPAWFFHRHADVRELMVHPGLSADRSHPGFPAISAGGKAAFRHFSTFLLSMDGEQHQRNRKPLIPHFSMHRMREFRPRIQQIVDEAVEGLRAAGPGSDLVTEIAAVVPRRVIAELMGVTPEHLTRFYDLATRFMDRTLTGAERDATALAMRQNMDALVEHKREHPGDDIVSHEIDRQLAEDGAVDVASLASTSQLMLLAGHESTCEMIALGAWALMRRPQDRDRLLAEPSRFPAAVAELIRFFSVVEIGMARVALEDIEIAGVTIRCGDGVIASNIAANRDPAVFARPDELVLDRSPNPHLAQGFGAHQCLGMNLAQVELTVIYETLFRTLPTLRPTPDDDVLPFKLNGLIFGLASLPVTW